MKLAVLAVLGALVSAKAEEAAVSDVHVLGDKTFEAFANDGGVSLVKFYAPWCGHCKNLAPEYDAAATELKAQGVRLAKVDCTENEALCAKHEIRGYPTLKVLKNGKSSDYEGPREASGIVKYMRRQTLPTVSELSLGKAADFGREHGVVVVGVFGSDAAGQKEAAAFAKIAESMGSEHVFATVKPGVYIVKAFDEGHAVFTPADAKSASLATAEGEAALRKWISVESTPLMDEISPENYAKYMSAGLPMAYLFYAKDEMRKEYGAVVEDLMRAYKGRINAVYIDAEKFDGHARALTLPATSWPGFVIHEPEADLKYPFTGEKLTRESLEGFLQSYASGALTPSFRSQPLPAEPEADGSVRTVVHANFADVVLSGKTDVLLEIYAPWCGACRRIAPAYEKVAAAYAGQGDKIVISKMDGTENDIPKEAGITLTKFPTIVLFKAGKKGMVEMDRPSDDPAVFHAFIKENATNSVTPAVEAAAAEDAGSGPSGASTADHDEL